MHANNAANSKQTEWFDAVAVDAGGGQIWYAQLGLLFAVGQNTISGQQLAMVRWYEEKPRNNQDVLVRHGCRPLRWEAVRNGTARYDIIPLSSSIKRLYVAPDFAMGEGHFHESLFKWDRAEVDQQGYQE